MNFTEYKALDAVNWSSLKHLRDSPLHYQHALTGADVDTTERAKGRAIHALAFEPAVFEREFAIYEDGNRRGKEWEAFKALHAGKTILKTNEMDDVIGSSNAVRTHPLVAPYLVGGAFEQTVTWTDPVTGLKCKARMDLTNAGMKALVDLKSSTTIDAYRFGRIAARLGYHCQLAHYNDGCTRGLGWTPAETLIVAVESSAPYDVAVFVLDDDTLFAGREEVQALLQRLKQCRESGQWPGRFTDKAALLLPAYVYGDDDDDATAGLTFGSGSQEK